MFKLEFIRSISTDRKKYKVLQKLISEKKKRIDHPSSSIASSSSSRSSSHFKRLDKKNFKRLDNSLPYDSTSTDKEKEKKQLWFNDPYLLSQKVAELMQDEKKITTAIELVERHRGAGNGQVYAVLFKGLAEHNLSSKAFKLYKKLKSMNREIAPQGYTSLLNCLADSASKSGGSITKEHILGEAQTIWNDLIIDGKEITIYHVNALLKVCMETLDQGGWKQAWELFENLDLEKEYDPLYRAIHRLVPDVITYTMMIKIASKSGTRQGTELGFQIWNELLDKGVKADIPLLNAMLMLYIHAPDDEIAQKGLDLIWSQFGFPKIPNQEPQLGNKKAVGLHTLTLFIQYAQRLKMIELGVQWYKLGQSKGNIKRFDQDIYLALSDLLMTGNHMERLFLILRDDRNAPSALKLRVIGTLVERFKVQNTVWWSRASQIGKEKGFENFDYQDMYYYLTIALAFHKYDVATSLCLKRQDDILKWSRVRLEDIIKKLAVLKDKGPLLAEKKKKLLDRIELNLNMLHLIKKMIKVIPKESETFYKKKLQLNLLRVQVDQLLDLLKEVS